MENFLADLFNLFLDWINRKINYFSFLVLNCCISKINIIKLKKLNKDILMSSHYHSLAIVLIRLRTKSIISNEICKLCMTEERAWPFAPLRISLILFCQWINTCRFLSFCPLIIIIIIFFQDSYLLYKYLEFKRTQIKTKLFSNVGCLKRQNTPSVVHIKPKIIQT